MNIKLKLETLERLTETSRVIKQLTYLNIENIDYIEFYNIQNILKKIADIMFKRAQFPGKKISLSIEPNQFKTLVKLRDISRDWLFKDGNIYAHIIINDICNQGLKQLQPLEISTQIFINNYNFVT